jgi:hypothetical protein
VFVEHPFGDAFESLVVEIAGAVEPRSGRRCEPNPVGAFDPVGRVEHIRPTEHDAAGEWCPVVR